MMGAIFAEEIPRFISWRVMEGMMNGTVNLPVLGRVDKRSALIGAGVLLLLLTAPKISDATLPVVQRVKNQLGGLVK